MSRFRLRVVLLGYFGLLFAAAPQAQEPAATTDDAESALQARIREYHRIPDHETAISELDAIIAAPETDAATLRTAFLLNIETHILYGTVFYDEGKASSGELYWEKAADLTRQMLEQPRFRSTQPPDDASPRMVQTFQSVRAEIFGTVRLESVTPENAEVRLNGELLLPDTVTGIRIAEDVPVGKHSLLVRANGYGDLVTQINVTPGGVISPIYKLEKRKGWTWWAWRVGAGVAAGTGIYMLSGGDDAPAEKAGPLPGPPAPPSKN